MKRAALYLRVSTDGQTVENQLAPLTRMAEAHGFTESDVFEETASGAKARPELRALLARCHRGEYAAIYVWALDRFARNLAETVEIVRGLDAAGVRLCSYSETWLDTASPVRPLLISIFAWVAQFERERLIERTKAGLARARAAGRVGGRPKASPLAVAAGLAAVADGISTVEAAQRAGISVSTLQRAARAANTPLPRRYWNNRPSS